MGEYSSSVENFVYTIPKVGTKIRLQPIGDVHHDAPNFARDKWLQDLEEMKKAHDEFDGHVLYFGMGDYLDFLSTSERIALRNSNFHDTTKASIEQNVKKNIEKFCDDLSFTKGKWVGMIEGNHHFRFSSGMSSTNIMCDYFGCKFLGINSFLRVTLRIPKTKKSWAVDIHAHHGRGGTTDTSSLNALNKMLNVSEADLYMMGHDHKKFVVGKNRFKFGHGNGKFTVKTREILLVRTGSYQLGYTEGEDCFIAKNVLPPSSLGNVKIDLIPVREYYKTPGGHKGEDLHVKYRAHI